MLVLFFLSTQHVAGEAENASALLTKFRSLGVNALSEDGLRALCATELAAHSAEPSLKTYSKLNSALSAVMGLAEWYVAHPLPEALSVLRQAAPAVHRILSEGWEAPTFEKDAASAVKRLFRCLFRSDDEVLSLAGTDAQLFLDFVSDVLFASTAISPDGNSPFLLSRPLVEVPRDFARFDEILSSALGALNTHDAKSAHPSAKFEGFFAQTAQASRYLSAQALPLYVSGRQGGGALQHFGWLETVLPFRLSVAGGPCVTVGELLTSAEARQALGVHAVLAELPLCGHRSEAFDGYQMPRVRIKVTEDESVALNLVPANSMLKANKALGELVHQKSAERLAWAAREKALAGLPQEVLASPAFALERFQACAATRGYGAGATSLLKELNACRKAAALALIESGPVLFDAWRLFAGAESLRQWLPQVPVLHGSHFPCGGAYSTVFGGKGVYRFPAANPQSRKDSAPLRRFHGGLESVFERETKSLANWLAKGPQLLECYQVGTKWLPARVQKNILSSHISSVATSYCKLLWDLRKQFILSEADRQSLVPTELSALQLFVLHGLQAEPAALHELAVRGKGLLRVNDKQGVEAFVTEVVQKLMEGPKQ